MFRSFTKHPASRQMLRLKVRNLNLYIKIYIFRAFIIIAFKGFESFAKMLQLALP